GLSTLQSRLHYRYSNISGTVAQVLALPPHSKKVLCSIPGWGAVGPGGQVLPRPSVLRWAISRAFFCVEFACSPRVHKGFPPIRTPTEKQGKKNSSPPRPSVTDGWLGPRALQAAHRPRGVL